MQRATKLQLHRDAMASSAASYDSIKKKFNDAGRSSTNPGPWLTNLYEDCPEMTEQGQIARLTRLAYKPIPQFRHVRYPGAEGPRNLSDDAVYAGYVSRENTSWVLTPLAYKINEVNDVRYSGDCHERTEALLREIDTSTVVLTSRSEIRKQGKDSDFTTPTRRSVSENELNVLYAHYTDPENPTDFAAIWELLFEYIFYKAESEYNDFDLNDRGNEGDAASDFLVSIHSAVSEKRFRGENDSKFSHYINASWFNFKCTWFKEQSEYDQQFISLTPQEPEVDADGKNRKTVPADEKFATQQYQRDLRRVDFEEQAATSVIEAAKAKLKPLHREMVEDMQAGVLQRDTAVKLGKSRFAVGRAQRAFKKQVQNKTPRVA